MNPERSFHIRVILIVYVIWLVLFMIVGRLAGPLPDYDLTSPLDRMIPLWPGFVWPYVFCYLYPLLPIFLVRDWHRFNRALIAFSVINLVAFAFYFVLPVDYPRADPGTTLSGRFLAFEYGVDFNPQANKLPSLHVANAWLIYTLCRRQSRKRWVDPVMLGLAILITVSTVFVKQHLVIDVVAGAALAWLAWRFATWAYPRITDASLSPEAALRLMGQRLWRPFRGSRPVAPPVEPRRPHRAREKEPAE